MCSHNLDFAHALWWVMTPCPYSIRVDLIYPYSNDSGLVQMANRHAHCNTNELTNAVVASLEVAVTGCCAFIEAPWAIIIGCEHLSWHSMIHTSMSALRVAM